jgi:hypothetical protein
VDLARELKNIEDHLIPKLQLDHVERALYYHLLRHTRLIGKEASLFGLPSLAKSSGFSESTLRDRIRILDEKGCIAIKERSAKGHLLGVLLPSEIDGLVPKPPEPPVLDINAIDFYSNRTYVDAVVKRENGRCFYCLRAINAETCVLDHVISKAMRGDASFRNVVACCHECNATKQSQDPTEFLRTRYRLSLLSQNELQERVSVLEKLQLGQLVPEI